MLTEKEYSSKANTKGILTYRVDFTLSPGQYFNNNITTYYIMVDIGYEHITSNFKMILAKGKKIIKRSSPFFNYRKKLNFKNENNIQKKIKFFNECW